VIEAAHIAELKRLAARQAADVVNAFAAASTDEERRRIEDTTASGGRLLRDAMVAAVREGGMSPAQVAQAAEVDEWFVLVALRTAGDDADGGHAA
jgi:hypothetical protein